MHLKASVQSLNKKKLSALPPHAWKIISMALPLWPRTKKKFLMAQQSIFLCHLSKHFELQHQLAQIYYRMKQLWQQFNGSFSCLAGGLSLAMTALRSHNMRFLNQSTSQETLPMTKYPRSIPIPDKSQKTNSRLFSQKSVWILNPKTNRGVQTQI